MPSAVILLIEKFYASEAIVTSCYVNSLNP